MLLVRDLNILENSTLLQKGSVLTIGTYDGLHLGHIEVLKRTLQKARELELPTVIILFEPQPEEYLKSKNAPARLTSFSDKLTIFKSLHVDLVLCLRFKKDLASLPAEKFVDLVLKNKLNAKYLVVGEDFAFGHQKDGTLSLLQNSETAFGFATEIVPSFFIDKIKVSATHIRHVLKRDGLQEVRKFLGRPYSMSGRVAYGMQRGRVLGFPTANIHLRHKVLPIAGVYVAKVSGIERDFFGVANIGLRPTFGGTYPLLEVHLLDFNDDIYGRKIRVDFLHKIRDEKKFSDLNELKMQIEQDVAYSRNFLKGKQYDSVSG